MDKVCVGQINADTNLPWVAGKYDMWEGKTRRDTLSRYGTKMAFPPDLERLPVLDQLNVGAASSGSSFVAPKSFDARTKWEECPSIGTIRNQGAILNHLTQAPSTPPSLSLPLSLSLSRLVFLPPCGSA